jgi:hypothetical protein
VINVAQGMIRFEEYATEVRGKGAFHYRGPEPLSYLHVDPSLPLPRGFESPNGVQPALYWASKKNRSNVVPYHFQTFEDVQRYRQ